MNGNHYPARPPAKKGALYRLGQLLVVLLVLLVILGVLVAVKLLWVALWA